MRQKKSFQVKIGELKEQREEPEPPEVRPSLGMTVEEITPEMAKSYGLSESSGLVVVQVEEGVGLATQFVGDMRRLGLLGRDDSDAHA